MKKRLFSLTLTLALCLGLAVPAFAADTSGLDANGAKAFYNALSAYGRKGIYVAYADLRDMNGDKSPELIAVTVPSEDSSVAAVDIWQIKNGNASKTYSDEFGASQEDGMLYVSQNGKLYICVWAGSLRQGAYASSSNYIGVDGLYESLSNWGDYNTGEDNYSRILNGVTSTITEKEYEQYKAKYKDEGDEFLACGGLSWYVDEKHHSSYQTVMNQLKTKAAEAHAPSGGFTDVKAGAYYADAVKWAVDKKITSGTSATTFSPDQTCTVAQILTFLWNANGKPEPTGRNPFSDISSGDYFYKAAVWAASKGLVSGTRLNPNALCTRAMVVEYLWKLAGSPSMNVVGGYSSQTITGTVDGTPCSIEFSAANIKETTLYITTHDKETVKKKVTFITVQPGSKMTIKGVPFIFIDEYANEGNGEYVQCGPMEPMEIKSGAFDDTKPDVDHRGNSAYGGIYHPDTWKLYFTGKNGNPYFLHIAFDSVSFTDVPSDAAYAQAVAWAVENGITAGTSDTTFSPSATCTRGHIVTFLHRAMG